MRQSDGAFSANSLAQTGFTRRESHEIGGQPESPDCRQVQLSVGEDECGFLRMPIAHQRVSRKMEISVTSWVEREPVRQSRIRSDQDISTQKSSNRTRLTGGVG